MQTVIHDLWYGNLMPQESGIFKRKEFKELLDYMERHQKALETTMNQEQKELYEKFIENRNEFDSIAEAEIFYYGFQLGAKLMCEVLANNRFSNK